jgi:hypothetical protein
LYEFLRIFNVFHRESNNTLSNFPSNTTFCYDYTIAGTGGTLAEWRDEKNPKFWTAVRNFFLASANCSQWIPQRAQSVPEVVLIQRNTRDGNVHELGNRLFKNVEVLSAILKDLDAKKVIKFSQVTVLSSKTPLKEQICRFRNAGIIVGIHGNALAFSTFMETGTVMVEVNPMHKYYRELSTSLNLQYLNYNQPDFDSMKAEVFLKLIMDAVTLWKLKFNK